MSAVLDDSIKVDDVELTTVNSPQGAADDDSPSVDSGDDVVLDDPNLPEMQCEEVDMDDEMMDPMEWTVRKILPIPKKYFWEGGGENEEKLSFRTKLWHRGVAIMGRGLRWAEFAGEVLSNVFGINSSRYQYVMDGMSEEDWERARRVNEERNREWDYNAEKEVAGEVGVDPKAI